MKIDNLTMNPQIAETTKEPQTVSNDAFEKILEAAKSSGETSDLRDAANQLEAVFINMLMKTMRSTVSDSEGIFKKSEAEKMFEGMLDEEYAAKMSEAGGIGISDMIFDQFEKYLYNDEDEKEVTSFEMKG